MIEDSTPATAADAACGPEHGFKLVAYGLMMIAGAAMLHTGNMMLFGSYLTISATVYLMQD